MEKSHIAIGVLVAAALVVGVTSLRSVNITATEDDVTAAVASTQGEIPAAPVLVTYTDNGFVPAVVKITRGTSLRFINTSNKALRIAPLVDPAFNTQAYRGFEGSTSIKKGDSFEISVSVPGIWGYKNLNAPGPVGVAVVE